MNGLDSAQIERLKQISEYLYHHRQEAGLSLEKIAQQTFIPLRLLEALESGQVDRLPEPVYIKGFIRRYADAVGLNGTEIADAFQVESNSLLQSPVSESKGLPEQPLPDRLTDSTHRHVDPAAERSHRSYLPWLAGIGAVAVVGAIALAAFNPFKPAAAPSSTSISTPEPSPSSSPSTESISPSPSPEASSSPTVSPSPFASASPSPFPSPSSGKPVASGSPVQLDISLTDRSWLEVVADGKTEFEGMMDKGTQRTWKAKKILTIRAGNAGAVVASFNQGAAKPLGKAGDVVDVEYPKP